MTAIIKQQIQELILLANDQPTPLKVINMIRNY